MTALPTLAFVGGTGKLGRGLGLRLAGAGHPALIGSRSEERARDTADKLRERLAAREPGRLEGMRNSAAISQAVIVFLALPFETLDAFLEERGTLLAGRIVVDIVNPEGDILLAGDDDEAKAAVTALVRAIPDLRPIDAGPLASTGLLESVTALQLNLNRLHRALTSIRIPGIG